MFNNSKNEQVIKRVNDHMIDTLIGPSANLEGYISSESNIRVDGVFNGGIVSESEVVIGETGSRAGDITATMITIYGTVKGNIKSNGLLEIMSTGKLFGDIDVNTISIKEGAIFKGKSCMTEKTKKFIAEEEAAAGIP